jgi:hypothetical protein
MEKPIDQIDDPSKIQLKEKKKEKLVFMLKENEKEKDGEIK